MAAKPVCLVKTTGVPQKGPASNEAFAMRLFVALEIPETVREKLAALQKRMRVENTGLRWVRPENFHVTLKFIGEVTSDELEGIKSELRGVRPEGPVRATFRGLGYSWNARRGGVFWATMEVTETMKMLAAQINRRLERLGMAAEEREFLPHLTLARFKRPDALPAIRAVVSEQQGRELGSLLSEELHLIESKLGPGGSKYLTLASFRFAQAANA
jgi:RNA 2',3'-cyclic 3'-phosphodiesterase